MSGGGQPQDRSVELRQLELDAAERERQRQEAATTARNAELAQLRSSATTGARGSAQNYFTQQGLVPGDYENDITAEINNILSSIAPNDPNPGSYFAGVGERAYGTAQTGQRNRAMRDLDRIFQPNMEYTRIPDTTDDPIIAAINAESRTEADTYLQNLLSRGVINETGFSAGGTALDKMAPGVMAILNEIGMGELETGRQGIREGTNRARSTASNLNLGQSFDPYAQSTQVDQQFSDWLSNLGTSFRGKTSGKTLYDTSGLGGVAGAGQGAQNLKFDPKALAGIFATEEEEQDPRLAPTSVF